MVTRRRMLQWLGGSAGAALGLGALGRYTLWPPSPSRELRPVDDLARELFTSLDAEQRAAVCVPYDHPMRQYHNQGLSAGGLGVQPQGFSRHQRRLVNDLLHASLSEAGRQRIPKQFFLTWGGVHRCRLLFCGDPHDEHYQAILSGPHLYHRIGGRSREGVAFGGPLVYGDQRGDGRQGIPGNTYRYQFQMAHDILKTLSRTQHERAVLARKPVQTAIVPGLSSELAGVRFDQLDVEARRLGQRLLEGILATYAPDDVAVAWDCLRHNGGIEEMAISYYAEGEVGGSGEYQVFRLEGPASVFYFHGEPHVHAYIYVAPDPATRLSVGEVLGHNAATAEAGGKPAVKALFEAAMRQQADCDFAYYKEDAVAGFLPPGPVRTGDIYAIECWRDGLAVVELRGDQIGGGLLAQLRQRGVDIVPQRTYRIATTAYIAGRHAEETLGAAGPVQRQGTIREHVVDYLRTHDFPTGS